MLDPFQYTMDMPYACNTAGEVCTDSTPNEVGNQGDQWNWTLGDQQYFWFHDELENSDAKFKFVFSHHVTGGMVDVGGGAGGPNYVRGGATAANFFEWGGRNAAGDYVFDTMRPGWGKPPHQLMIDEGVTAFYHGHDHVYALEEADEVIYHEIPHVSVDGGLGFGLYSVADPFTTMVIENGGHLRVTVDPEAGAEGEALAEYIRESTDGNPVNGSVAHSYTMTPRAAATPVPGPPDLSGQHRWCDGGRHRWWRSLVGDHGGGDVDPGAEPDRQRDGSDHQHQHLCSAAGRRAERGVPVDPAHPDGRRRRNGPAELRLHGAIG